MNKPWYLLPCIFAYKTILFIIKLPILFLKYFSLGFFFTTVFLIDIIVTTIYLIIKYLIFGFIRISKWLYLGFKTVLKPFKFKKKKQTVLNTDINEKNNNFLSDNKNIVVPLTDTITSDFVKGYENNIENNSKTGYLSNELKQDFILENVIPNEEIKIKEKSVEPIIRKKINPFTPITNFFIYFAFGFIRVSKWLYLGFKTVLKPLKFKKKKQIKNDEIIPLNDNKPIIVSEIENNLPEIEENIFTEELEKIENEVPIVEEYNISNNETTTELESSYENNELKYDPNVIYEQNVEPIIKKKNNPFLFIIKIITKPFVWLTYGFMFECYILYRLFKSLVYGILFPLLLVYYVISTISFKYNLAIEKKKIKAEREFQEEIRTSKGLKQQEKTKDLFIEKESIKKQNDENDYVIKEDKEEFQKEIKDIRSFNDKINDIFIAIGEIPKNIKNRISKWYHSLSIVKNLDNQKSLASEALLLKFDGDDALKSPVKIVYEYRAKNPQGKVVTDYFDAYSKVEVHSFLLSEGYEVYNIRTSKSIQFLHGSNSFFKPKFKNKDLIFFLTQLSTYLKAGITLVEALKVLGRQYSKKKAYQKIFRKMIYDLTMGESFSSALDKQGEVFPRLLINMIKASELTGELPEALDKMADYYTEANKTKQQMITALTYPIIVLVVAIGVLIFIMLFIIPKFVAIYDTMDNVQVPQITRIILNVSNFLQANLLWVTLGILSFLFIFIYLYKNIKAFRTVIQLLVMRLPIFGNIIIFNEVTMFTQTLGTLLSHNVFITDSMEILNKITNNEVYKMIILDTINNIAKGEKISEAFVHWAFPIPAYEMIVTGEKTGQLPEMMERVGNYYQELHRNSVTRIKTFIEPVLIIFLTLMVGIIVLAIVIPMFSMYDSVQGSG